MTTVRTRCRVAVVLMATMAASAGFARGTDSVEELVRIAERGDAQAQFDLGFMYATGISHFEVDDAEAVSWYRRAAEQGFAPAQSALGRAYAHGPVLEQDFTQAATWCRLGAEQGDADGQLCMASLYAGGCGVEQDYAESARWHRLAADGGSGVAQARLGDMYATGEGGVPQDPVDTRSMPKEARQQRVLRALFPVARLGYPVARLWWRSSAAIRARSSPPVLADALMTAGSSRAPACMTATTTSTDT